MTVFIACADASDSLTLTHSNGNACCCCCCRGDCCGVCVRVYVCMCVFGGVRRHGRWKP
jgi:hypothetical protein